MIYIFIFNSTVLKAARADTRKAFIRHILRYIRGAFLLGVTTLIFLL